MDLITARDPLIQLFCLLSQCKIQYKIRADQSQSTVTIEFGKIYIYRYAQSYCHSKIASRPSINKDKCIWKSIWFLATELCSTSIIFFFQQPGDRTHLSPENDSCMLFSLYFFLQRPSLVTALERNSSSRKPLRIIVRVHAKVATACS